MNKFTVCANQFLNQDIPGFYTTDYTGYENPGNPDYLNHLKNTYNSFSKSKLNLATLNLSRVLMHDLAKLTAELGLNEAWVCVVPRSKSLDSYSQDQLLFSQTVRAVTQTYPQLHDGTDFIKRHTSTRTTHLSKHDKVGKLPYPGITRDTCYISSQVKGKDILLVDDIYTKSVNVDEDVIQALLDNGAHSVALYVVAKTVKKF